MHLLREFPTDPDSSMQDLADAIPLRVVDQRMRILNQHGLYEHHVLACQMCACMHPSTIDAIHSTYIYSMQVFSEYCNRLFRRYRM